MPLPSNIRSLVYKLVWVFLIIGLTTSCVQKKNESITLSDQREISSKAKEKVSQTQLIISDPGDTIPTGIPIPAKSKWINPHFEYFSADNGLSENSIFNIIQDRHGFIWIGTGDGLNRYDGYSFKTYRRDPDDPNSISSNVISFIFEDSKSGLWIGTQNNVSGGGGPGKLNRLDRATGKFERFEYDPDDPNSISNDAVTNLFEDSRKNLWLCTEGGGINRFDYQTSQFEAFQFGPEEPDHENANSIYFVVEDSDGILWMDNYEAGLNSLDPSSGELKRYQHEPDDPNSLSDNIVFAIMEDSNKVLWIGTNNGLNRLDRKTGHFERFLPDPDDPQSLSHRRVEIIFEDTQKNLWISTGNGLNRLDRSTGKFEHFQHDPETPGSICGNSINDIIEDLEGNLWIATVSGIALMDRNEGTFECTQINQNISCITRDISGNFWLGSSWAGAKGLSRMDLVSANLQHFQNNPQNPNSLMDDAVWPILEDSDGYIWIGMSPLGTGGGLDRLDRTTGKFEHFKHDPNDNKSIANNRIFSLFEDSEGYLWVGYNAGVLDRLDRETGKVVKWFLRKNQDSTTIQIGQITQMLEDPEGNLWFGGGNGVNKLDKTTGLFHHYLPFQDAKDPWADNFIESMILDSEGYIWAGTWHKGLCRLDPGTGQFEYFEHNPDDPNSLSHNGVWSLHEDAQKNIWVGTGFGLNRLDRGTGKFTCYYERDGLPNSFIFGIVEDDHGWLWLSTNKGISRFDPKTETFRNLDVHDGLQGNQFNYFAYFKSSRSGELFFGGNNGFNIFHPDSMEVDTFAPPVAISSFTHYNQKEGRPIMDDFISDKEKITLSYSDNNLSFEFAALNFRKTAKTQYKYQLEGISDQWYELGNKRELTFTDLDPGDYTLRVMAANSDGIWNPQPTELAIQILPPWWATWWARAFYFLIGIGLLWFIIKRRERFFVLEKQKLELKVTERTAEVLAQKNRAERSEKFKQQFLANMSHEIRTPITAVLGMTNLVLDSPLAPKQTDYLKAVKKSSYNLLTIINDILDLSKLEAGKMELEKIPFRIKYAIDQVNDTLRFKAEEKGLKLITKIDSKVPEVVLGDPTRLNQILINLAGNAVKFTDKGSVKIIVEKADKTSNNLNFRIIDTGIGIPADKLNLLFKLFQQVDSSTSRKYGGTGLGLSISKTLVELQEGSIKVNSEEGKGSEFSFFIPYEVSSENMLSGFNNAQWIEKATLDGIKILIAEDNEYNQIVVRDTLENLINNVKIDIAENGKIAVNKLIHGDYDLILMDVQMPEMSGLEACIYIRGSLDSPKKDIPIIALTASVLTNEIKKIKESGMNAYIPKPFKRKELLQGLALFYNNPNGQEKEASALMEKVTTVPESKNSKVTDMTFLKKFTEGDEERMKKYIQLFLKATPKNLDKVSAALEQEDYTSLGRVIHAMKPQINYMGMKQARQLAEDIEQFATDKSNLEEIPVLVHQLMEHCKKSYAELAI